MQRREEAQRRTVEHADKVTTSKKAAVGRLGGWEGGMLVTGEKATTGRDNPIPWVGNSGRADDSRNWGSESQPLRSGSQPLGIMHMPYRSGWVDLNLSPARFRTWA